MLFPGDCLALLCSVDVCHGPDALPFLWGRERF